MATAAIGGLVAAAGAAAAGATVAGIVVAGVLAAGSSYLQERAANKRQKSQEKAVAEQRRQQAISNAQQEVARARAIRQSIAQERVQRAQLESAAFASGSEGVGQSITGDTGTAIGAAQAQQAAAFGISQSQDRQAQFMLDARSFNSYDRWAGVLKAGQAGFSLYSQGAFEGLGSLFGSPNNSSVIDPNTSNANVYAGGFAGR